MNDQLTARLHPDQGGPVAVVTGGSTGIGLATVSELVTSGRRVVALARDPHRLRDALESLPPAAAGVAWAVSADVTSEDEVRAALAGVIDRWGRIDAVVNSAGVSMSARRTLRETTTVEWRRLVDTNLTGTYLMCREALSHMRSGGYVVNVLSTGAHRAAPGMSLYAATKFGARAITESLAIELQSSGIRSSSVSPGPVDTPIWDRKLEPPDARTRARMLRPSDIAEVIRWLLDRPAHLHIPDITVTPWHAGENRDD